VVDWVLVEKNRGRPFIFFLADSSNVPVANSSCRQPEYSPPSSAIEIGAAVGVRCTSKFGQVNHSLISRMWELRLPCLAGGGVELNRSSLSLAIVRNVTASVCAIVTYICSMSMISHMKRTTLIIEDSCLEGIRNLAHREGKNLSQVANELFAEGLQRCKARKKPEFKIVSYSMGKPRVNLGDRNALEALMDS
jgi:hypothetical protein